MSSRSSEQVRIIATLVLTLAATSAVASLAGLLTAGGQGLHPAETAWGAAATLLLLVLNVCIGVLLIGQGTAQLVQDVPPTPAEILAKMATFAALTLVAGGLLLRTRRSGGVYLRPSKVIP